MKLGELRYSHRTGDGFVRFDKRVDHLNPEAFIEIIDSWVEGLQAMKDIAQKHLHEMAKEVPTVGGMQ